MLVTIALLVGAALGQRFRVAALLPATGVLLTAVVLYGFLRHSSALDTVLAAIFAMIALEAGYVVGLAARWWAERRANLQQRAPVGTLNRPAKLPLT